MIFQAYIVFGGSAACYLALLGTNHEVKDKVFEETLAHRKPSLLRPLTGLKVLLFCRSCWRNEHKQRCFLCICSAC